MNNQEFNNQLNYLYDARDVAEDRSDINAVYIIDDLIMQLQNDRLREIDDGL